MPGEPRDDDAPAAAAEPPTAGSSDAAPVEPSMGAGATPAASDAAPATHPTAAPVLRPPPEVERPPARARPWLHALLFALTFVSATWAYLAPGETGGGYVQALVASVRDWQQLRQALLFAGCLMAILLAHEMGHYVTARRSGVDQSLPYFIPAPTLVGTLGAIILMRSQPPNRSVLLRVAVMGPALGLLFAVPAAAWGLAMSGPATSGEVDPARPLLFGSSLLFGWLERLFGPDAPVVNLHPVAFAGWVGLFVTSLNLIPASQLDGGHIAYALFGRRQARLSAGVVLLLFVIGLLAALPLSSGEPTWGGVMWIVWAILLFVIGVRHPEVADEQRPLTGPERAAGWLSLVVFVATFVPVPVTVLAEPRQGAPGFELPVDERDEPTGASPAEEFRL